MDAFEANFDGLIGLTHNYAGLSKGNVASLKNAGEVSNPKEAATQGLRKMKALHDWGFKQGVLPPQQRPDLQSLRDIGFTGTDEQILAKTSREAPEILAAVYSASSMWTANAATVSPSADTADRRLHFTPANLVSKFHRSIESTLTSRVLRKIFSDEKYFVHHPSLPPTGTFGDEGAANHTRLCKKYGSSGCELFVYGRAVLKTQGREPKKYPARQTLEASQAVARQHGLDPTKTVFAQQNPEAIDAGVFHNDVISVGNRNVFFFHEKTFLEQKKVLDELRARNSEAFHWVEVKNSQVTLQDAVASYLFNSQLLSLRDESMLLLVPEECRKTPSVWEYLQSLVATKKSPIQKVEVFDLKQSMQNGGGPACLRLRVVLTKEEFESTAPGVWMSEKLYTQLLSWVDKYYRDRLAPADLADPSLLDESYLALDELTRILGVGSIYPFQKA